ncbi:MAG: arsenite methyltransferase [Candidatus Bathyarchaeota archaeon]|nr:arsenite methyltransferase [Candidatus Bathyarchaeota archaeon]MDH5747259.1 arsenite methyltransferase [Candidatus Bathyarchaeota archaeon]
MEKEKIKKVVREGYAKIAKTEDSCCGSTVSCCDSTNVHDETSKMIGYSEEELRSVPEGANLGLGCGNPIALASLKKGETVLDLGSGAGLDCFLAANKVGEKGRVIGVDMTPEMVDKARENATESSYKNVEFRLGEIENLPVADNTVDVIISNCVINLSPNKGRVFKEAFRALKPGGRLMVSDIVLLKELPEVIKKSVKAYIGCLSGAIMKDKYIETIKKAGFQEVKIIEETHFPIEYMSNDPTAKAVMENSGISVEKVKEIANSAASIKVYGTKPSK